MLRRIRIFAPIMAVTLGLSLSTNLAAAEYSRTLVYENLQKAMSRIVFDPGLLRVKPGDNWMSSLSFNAVTSAVGDIQLNEADANKTMQRLRLKTDNGGIALRLDPDQGLVRYINSQRNWNYQRDAQKPPVTDEMAEQLARSAFTRLGLPSVELGSLKVLTQMGRAGGTNLSMRAMDWPMARLIAIQRQMSVTGDTQRTYKVPVLGSSALIAVVDNGSSTASNPLIQRMLVKWPSFRMNSMLRMRSASSVALQAMAAIMSEKLSDEDKKLGEIAKIDAFVAYSNVYDLPNGIDSHEAENNVEGASPFLPIVVINVYPPEGSSSAPMQLSIPMAL